MWSSDFLYSPLVAIRLSENRAGPGDDAGQNKRRRWVMMGAISISLPFELEVRLREEAKRQGRTLSAIVAEALKEYFKEHEGEQ